MTVDRAKLVAAEQWLDDILSEHEELELTTHGAVRTVLDALGDQRPAIEALREWFKMQSSANTTNLYDAAAKLFDSSARKRTGSNDPLKKERPTRGRAQAKEPNS